MHELSITQSIFDMVTKYAEEAKAKRVAQVNLVLGEMTGVVPDCVQFYFDVIAKDTVAKGAKLNVTVVPGRLKCRACGKDFLMEEYKSACPYCKATDVEFIAGRELFVESIEVE
jgi:hydrogenase nickel incorporation protein HypA/HybF